MAQELLLALQPHVQGVYIMPSFGRYEVAAEVLEVLQVGGGGEVGGCLSLARSPSAASG
jgi:hypothetical protein